MSSSIQNASQQANGLLRSAPASTPADTLSRLSAAQGGEGMPSTSQLFSQWMDQHAQASQRDGLAPGKGTATPLTPPENAPVSPLAAWRNQAAMQARQTQSQAHHPDALVAKSPATSAAPSAAATRASTPAVRSAPSPAPAQAKQDGPDRRDKVKQDADASEHTATQADAQTASAEKADAAPSTAPGDVAPGSSIASMMAWLSHLQARTPVQPPAGDAAGTSRAALGDAQALSASTDSLLGAAAGPLAAQTGSSDPAAWQGASSAAALQLDAMVSPRGLKADRAVDTEALGALLAGRTPESNTLSAKPEAVALRHESSTLDAPFGSTDFAQTLADKVSMWVSSARTDGPMTAELHLNPAEMGPINVKISLDGDTAHVSFAAAALETRQALEASMPLLSQSLDSVGLSLSGGDVSSQTSQQAFDQAQAQGDGRLASPGGRVGSGADRDDESRVMRQVAAPQAGRLGGLDLYA